MLFVRSLSLVLCVLFGSWLLPFLFHVCQFTWSFTLYCRRVMIVARFQCCYFHLSTILLLLFCCCVYSTVSQLLCKCHTRFSRKKIYKNVRQIVYIVYAYLLFSVSCILILYNFHFSLSSALILLCFLFLYAISSVDGAKNGK